MANNKSSSEILKSIWRRRQTKSQGPSLRTLAKHLGKSPGYLSKIFSGQANLPKELIDPLMDALQMDSPSRLQFIEAMTRETLRKSLGTVTRRVPKKNEVVVESSPLDSYELAPPEAEWLLGQWHRTALLDLTTLSNFQNDADWMSKKLGIPKSEVELSLKYLIDAGLLVPSQGGQYKKKYLHLRFPSRLPKQVFRQHHISQMKRAIQCIETQTTPKDFSERLIFGVTVACNQSELENVKLALHKAVYEAAQNLSRGDCEEVYQINLQIFPQTKKEQS